MGNRFDHINMLVSKCQEIERQTGNPCPMNPVPILQCSQCGKHCVGEKNECTAMLCRKCKGFWYCSKECQKTDWANPQIYRAHKNICKKIERYMSRAPTFIENLNSFPWATGTDEIYDRDVILARFHLLDTSPQKVGYWVQSPEIFQSSSEKRVDETGQAFSALSIRENAKSYRDGSILLDSEIWESLTDEGGWKLVDYVIRGAGGEVFVRFPATEGRIVPRLQFDSTSPPPDQLPGKTVVDWDSWYRWRGLSKESPAALLMDFPLTMYWLITRVLGIVSEEELEWKENKLGSRRELDIHCVGARGELNFLPIFSELALLIPNVDIILTFFGPSVYALLANAKSHHPSSPAGRAANVTSLENDKTIYRYTAPKSLGGSTIKMKLYGRQEYWNEGILKKNRRGDDINQTQKESEDGGLPIPDALVGFNTVLASGQKNWIEPVFRSWEVDIPFAITEHNEDDIDMDVEAFLKRFMDSVEKSFGGQLPGIPFSTGLPRFRFDPDEWCLTLERNPEPNSNSNAASHQKQESEPRSSSSSPKPSSSHDTVTKTSDEKLGGRSANQREVGQESEFTKSAFSVRINPFARPGQRPMATTGIPSFSNGFILKVAGSYDENVKENEDDLN